MSTGKHITNQGFFFSSWVCLSNAEDKTENDEPQMLVNLIKLKVIKMLPDYHAVLFRLADHYSLIIWRLFFHHVLWDIILMIFVSIKH